MEIDKYINQVILGDCIEVMKQFPDNSIHAIVTDPPYGLSFMSKEFDTFKYKWKEFKKIPKEWIEEYENKQSL